MVLGETSSGSMGEMRKLNISNDFLRELKAIRCLVNNSYQ